MSICSYCINYNAFEVNALYQHIRDLREYADLTQQELANLLHISQATYSRYENGALDIPSSALITLARFYKTSIDYLVGLTNDRTQRWK